eukprot:2333102-Alexandrium_andersonii.AAC.1
MVLLRGPREARQAMGRRLARDPLLRTATGAFRLLHFTSIRPAMRGLARDNTQAAHLPHALRAPGAARRRRDATFCLL